MRAMRAREAGAALSLDEVPRPEPGPGQALIRVRAAGVNFADTLMVRGAYQERPAFPVTPGMECCGVVEALGEGAESPAPGARVAAFVSGGAFADYALAPAAACVPAPDAMPDEIAATIQIAYGTGEVALNHRARLQPGERLLVLGAAGGVGLTAVEIGRLMGAEVIAAARGAEKLALAGAAGAHYLIEADPETLRDAVKALGGADVVYDPVGGALWREALRAANPGARLIPIGFASGEIPQIPANILLVKNLDVIGLYWGAYLTFRPEVLRESMERIFGWWARGEIAPPVSDRMPLERAEDALELLRTRKATGKVALTL